jgi:hypothetical protein
MLIEDYGLIGDMQSAALVGRNGAIDWLCLPRFDSASCFSAVVGDERHGRWLVAPAGEIRSTSRRYRPGTLVLETDFEGPDGVVRVIDFMPRRGDGPPRVMRIVEGLRGRVPMRMELALRPEYGSIKPWVEHASDGALAMAGPDGFRLSTPLELHVEDGTVRAEFVAAARRGRGLGTGAHGRLVARLEWALQLPRRVSRGGAHLADRAQGDDLGDDRSADRRTDDVAAGGARRSTQLGLSLLLAA